MPYDGFDFISIPFLLFTCSGSGTLSPSSPYLHLLLKNVTLHWQIPSPEMSPHPRHPASQTLVRLTPSTPPPELTSPAQGRSIQRCQASPISTPIPLTLL